MITPEQPRTPEGRALLEWCNRVQYDDRNRERVLAIEEDAYHKGIEDTLHSIDSARRAQARPDQDEAVRLLREAEWGCSIHDDSEAGGYEIDRECPICHGWQSSGHEAGCRLAAAIATPPPATRPEQDEAVRLLDAYEELVQQLHAAAYDDPDMQTREWERRLNAEWDALQQRRAALATPPPTPAALDEAVRSLAPVSVAMERLRAALATPPPAATPESTPAALDDCPCGHDENEHVHYCSAITEDGQSCGCIQDYARLTTPEASDD